MKRRVVFWLAACMATTACGAAVHQAATTTGSTPGPSRPPSSGQAIFARDCLSCHTLIGNESAHKQGGDLLGYAMTADQLLGFTRVMPTPHLTAAQLNAVVAYVLAAQRRGHR